MLLQNLGNLRQLKILKNNLHLPGKSFLSIVYILVSISVGYMLVLPHMTISAKLGLRPQNGECVTFCK